MLNLNETFSWTIDECVKVRESIEYVGEGQWKSKLCSEYLIEENLSDINWRIADHYVKNFHNKSLTTD